MLRRGAATLSLMGAALGPGSSTERHGQPSPADPPAAAHNYLLFGRRRWDRGGDGGVKVEAGVGLHLIRGYELWGRPRNVL